MACGGDDSPAARPTERIDDSGADGAEVAVGRVGIPCEEPEERERWALVDLSASPEGLPRSLVAPAPEPADELDEDDGG